MRKLVVPAPVYIGGSYLAYCSGSGAMVGAVVEILRRSGPSEQQRPEHGAKTKSTICSISSPAAAYIRPSSAPCRACKRVGGSALCARQWPTPVSTPPATANALTTPSNSTAGTLPAAGLKHTLACIQPTPDRLVFTRSLLLDWASENT